MKLTIGVMAALLGVSQGVYEEGRTSLMGAFIHREYIATVKVGEDVSCDSFVGKVSAARSRIQGAERAARDGIIEEAKIGRKCFVTFKGDDEVRDEVLAMGEVEAIEPNQFVQTMREPWGLDRIDETDLPMDNQPIQRTHTGRGVKVYVIDTGILNTHNEFGSRAVIGGDFVNENSRTDGNGHGTHCSGTVAGTNYGVAPDATVIGVKVLSRSGSGTNSGVLNGIRWAQDNSAGETAVLSMSLGGGRSTAINNAVNEASRAGNIVVVAAGNENQDACNVSPASAGGNGANGGVITVASMTRTDARSSFSNWGSCVDIFAPGSDVLSAWIGSNSATRTISGTSMACPHVAGVAATLLEKHGGSKSAAVEELFSYYAPNKISGARGTPNKLVQVPYPGATAAPSDGPTPLPPTPAPTSEPCWWWCRPASNGISTSAEAAEEPSSLPMIIGIAGATVGFAGLVAGVVISRRKKTETVVESVNPKIDL